MKKFTLIYLALGLIISACNQNSKKNDANMSTHPENISTLWVNSYKVNCTGVAKQLCLLVQKGPEIIPGNWEHFYTTIEGFDWKPGFIYELKVKQTQLPKDQVPADAPSIKYSLIEDVKKEVDPVIRLHDIWALESIDGKAWVGQALERPNLEINLTQRRVMGTDGCNRYQGEIKSISSDALILGPLAGTKKACPDMAGSYLFNKKLAQVQSYTLKQLVLTLLDEDGKTLMQFRKVD